MNMSDLKYPRGSEWRKWDLHVHTPLDPEWINRPNLTNTKDKIEFAEKFIAFTKKQEISVLAIVDHNFCNSLDDSLIPYIQEKAYENGIIILPGFEITARDGSGIHLLVIFPENTELRKIKSIIDQCFAPDTNLIPSDSTVPVSNKTIDEIKQIIDASGIESIFIFAHSDRENGVLHGATIRGARRVQEWHKDFINIAQISKDPSAYSEKTFMYKLINGLDINYKREMTYIIASDCRTINPTDAIEGRHYLGQKYVWIKADPTFEGLKQIIYEPRERVSFEEPELLKRIHGNKTKFIRSLKINQVLGYDGKQGVWFKNIVIPFNPGLVAIIGNKGSGKSAIVDILGLCGNSYQNEDFSFLKEDRFLKKGLAKNFEATLEWEDGSTINKNLSQKPDFSSPERVRYLPQSFFEKLTNEIEEREFPQTLENIVFSYLPDDQKLGKSSFQELIKFKQDAIEKEIKLVLSEIDELNEKIIELEKKQHPAYRKELEEKLSLKKKELEEHRKNKPEEVKNPEKDSKLTKVQQKSYKELDKLKKESKRLEKEINEKREVLKKLTIDHEELDQLIRGLELEKQRIEKFKQENKEKLEKFGLNIDTIITFETNTQVLEQKIKERKHHINDIQELLLTNEEIEKRGEKERNILREKSLLVKKENINSKIKKITKKLSEPERKYQEYLENLKNWEETEKEILGSKDKVDTIKWLETQIEFIQSELNNKLDSLRKQRLTKTLNIYDKKNELVEIYKQFKKAVDEKISSHSEILGDYEINIESALNIKNEFINKFLSFINQKLKGSFYGKEEGESLLREILNNIDVNSKMDVQKLLENIIGLLEIDHREAFKNKLNEEKRRYIFEQVKEIKDFYNYLFSLEYIEPIYELKLCSKSISQLSPGEKGALLIVFYLMLDKDNIPLIIDQPEENLDNESIYKILTKFIKLAKQRRQLIMVTHNPNLAIVGDAEQIIYVNIDKKNSNKFSFKSGAIENPVINKHASNILEGTLNAFDIRRLKYFRYK